MKNIERIYNRYFNNAIDKVTLGVILSYMVCIILLSLLLLAGNDTILISIVNRISESIPFYIPALIGMMIMVRYYQRVPENNVLDQIIPKSHKNRFLDIIKLYIGLGIGFIFLLSIHRVVMPVVISVSRNEILSITEIFSYTFMMGILGVSTFILFGLYYIGMSVFIESEKFNLFISFVIIFICFNVYTKGGSVIIRMLITEGDTSYILTSGVKIIANIILSFAIGKLILNNIDEIEVSR